MDNIDLDAIRLKYITKTKEVVYPTKEQVNDMMREAIRQALVLASEKAKSAISTNSESDLGIKKRIEQSILDVEKLVKG